MEFVNLCAKNTRYN